MFHKKKDQGHITNKCMFISMHNLPYLPYRITLMHDHMNACLWYIKDL